MVPLQIPLDSLGTKLAFVERELFPRLEAYDLVLSNFELNSALLSTKAAVSFDEFVGFAPRFPPAWRLIVQVRPELLFQDFDRGGKLRHADNLYPNRESILWKITSDEFCKPRFDYERPGVHGLLCGVDDVRCFGNVSDGSRRRFIKPRAGGVGDRRADSHRFGAASSCRNTHRPNRRQADVHRVDADLWRIHVRREFCFKFRKPSILGIRLWIVRLDVRRRRGIYISLVSEREAGNSARTSWNRKCRHNGYGARCALSSQTVYERRIRSGRLAQAAAGVRRCFGADVRSVRAHRSTQKTGSLHKEEVFGHGCSPSHAAGLEVRSLLRAFVWRIRGSFSMADSLLRYGVRHAAGFRGNVGQPVQRAVGAYPRNRRSAGRSDRRTIHSLLCVCWG